jgi:hypothetical protein
MLNVNRRQFILSSLMLLPGTYILGGSFLKNIDQMNNIEKNEYIVVYNELKMQGVDPSMTLLMKLGGDKIDNLKDLEDLFISDFNKGNIFEVQGLVLSFCEAIFIGFIGKQMFHKLNAHIV